MAYVPMHRNRVGGEREGNAAGAANTQPLPSQKHHAGSSLSVEVIAVVEVEVEVAPLDPCVYLVPSARELLHVGLPLSLASGLLLLPLLPVARLPAAQTLGPVGGGVESRKGRYGKSGSSTGTGSLGGLHPWGRQRVEKGSE